MNKQYHGRATNVMNEIVWYYNGGIAFHATLYLKAGLHKKVEITYDNMNAEANFVFVMW